MRRIFWGLLLLLLIVPLSLLNADKKDAILKQVSDIQEEAQSNKIKGHAKVRRDYRGAITKTFQFADRIEVYLLDFAMDKDLLEKAKENDAIFPIRPYDKETAILKTSKVPVKEIPKWCDAITQLLTGEYSGEAMCHYPVHGIRIYAGDLVLLETSICWYCGNYYFTYSGHSSWEGLPSNAVDNMSKLVHQLVPIPEVERKRFEKEYGGKEK